MNDPKKILFALIAVLGVSFLGYRVLLTRHSDKFCKPMLKTPDFKFQDSSGRMFSSDDLKGKVWVVDFIFTRCAGSCPMLTHQMSVLQEAWRGNGDLKLVSFTVDPDHDNLKVLKHYAEETKADPAQWSFLWGPKKIIYPVIHEFKVTAEPDPEGDPGAEFIHSTRMILVDGQGMMRGLYDGQDDEDMKKLWADVRYLMGSRGHT